MVVFCFAHLPLSKPYRLGCANWSRMTPLHVLRICMAKKQLWQASGSSSLVTASHETNWRMNYINIYIYIWADAGLHSSCKDTSYRSKHKKTKWPGVQPTHSSLWEFNLTSLPESCISQWLHQRNKQFSDFYGENCSYRCVAKFSTAGRETQSSKDHGCGIGWRSNKKWWKSIFHQKIFRSPHHQA